MEKIGLAAVMEMTQFTKGINDYNTKVNGASDNTEKGAGKISKAFGAIGKAALGLAAGGIAALAGAAVASIKVFGDWADKVDNVGDVLGTTAEESSALAVAAESIGGDVVQLTTQMAKLTQGLFDANGELGPSGKLMEQLGISFRDANGQLLPTTEILQNVADKVGNMDDGLQKTDVMMQLFGKSGKDMSDLMGALANGGMEAMNKKAKELGLSMSEEGTAGAIQFGRSMNDLKLMGKGLMVTLGSELLPLLQPLIKDFVELGIKAIPYVKAAIEAAIPVIQSIFKWIGENLIPIVESLVRWMAEHVPPAVAKAVEIFTTYFLPAIAKVWEFIKDPLLPILGDIAEWLLVAIGKAVEVALPIIGKWISACVDVYTYVFTNLLPILEKIVLWLTVAIGNAIATFKTIWDGLKTAFKTVSDFIYEKLTGPSGMFTKIGNFLGDIAGPITSFANGAARTLAGAFSSIWSVLKPLVDAVKWLIDNIGGAISGLTGFTGAIGKWVSDAFLGLGDVEAPGGGKPGGPSGPRRMPEIRGAGGSTLSTSNTVNLYMNVALNNGMDTEQFRVFVLDTVAGAIA